MSATNSVDSAGMRFSALTYSKVTRGLLRHASIFIPLALFAVSVHAWFTLGSITGDDFSAPPSRDPDILKSFFPWPSLWDPSYITGFDQSLWLPQFPLWSLAGALARVGASWPGIERMLWLYPLVILIVIAPYLAAMRLTRNPFAAATCATLYSLNTWTIGLIERGHLSSLLSYAIMPLTLLAAHSLSHARKLSSAIYFAALFTIQVCFDIRYAYIVCLFLILALFFQVAGLTRARERKEIYPALAETIKTWGLAFCLVLVLNAYWIGTIMTAPNPYVSTIGAGNELASATNPESWLSAISLYYPYYQYKWGLDPFAVGVVDWTFTILPIAVLGALVLTRRRKLAIRIAAVALTGVVLCAASGAPRAAISHVPGMVMFRDPTKFSAIVALAYAAALALGAARIAAILRRRISKPARIAIAIGMLLGYAFIMRDAYSPARFSNFAVLPSRPQDKEIADFISRRPTYERTLFFPAAPYTIHSTALHPTLSTSELQSIYPGLGDPYSLSAYLSSDAMPVILQQLNIGTVILTDDPTNFMYRPFGYNFQYSEGATVLEHLHWLKKVGTFGKYKVYSIRGSHSSVAFQPNVVFRSYADADSAVSELAGTALWNPNTAIVSSAAPANNLSPYSKFSDRVIPNVIESGWSEREGWHLTSSPALPMYTDSVSGAVLFAFGPRAMQDTLQTRRPVDFFKNDFYVPRSTKAVLIGQSTPVISDWIVSARSFRFNKAQAALSSIPIVLNPPDSSGDVPMYGLPLDVSINTLQDGTSVFVRDARNLTQHRTARVSIFPALSIPLSDDPTLRVRLTTPGPPLRVWIEIVLSDLKNNETIRVEEPASGVNGLFNSSLRAVAQGQFDEAWSRLRKMHEGDFYWISAHGLEYPKAAADYKVRAVNILVDLAPGVVLPEDSEVSIRQATITAGSPAAAVRMQKINAINVPFRPSSASVVENGLASKGIIASSNHLALSLTLAKSPEAVQLSHLNRGDFVFVSTRHGNVAGTVDAASPGTLFVESPQRHDAIPWDEIRGIERVVPQRLSVDVPLPDVGGVSTIGFDANANVPLQFSVLLGSRGSDGNVRYYSATNVPFEQRQDASGNQVPSEWTWQTLTADGAPTLPIGVPLNLLKARIGPAPMQHYELKVPDIRFANSLGQNNPISVIRFQVTIPNGTITNHDTANFAISNLIVKGLHVPGNRRSDNPAIVMDGTAFAIPPQGLRRTLSLRSGWHHIETQNTELDSVKRALLIQGAVRATPTHSDQLVISRDAPNEIEARGFQSTPVIALAENYSPGWQMAAIPSSTHLTGDLISDYFTVRRYLVRDHFMLNRALNAWSCIDCRRVVFMYKPDILARMFALLSLAAFALMSGFLIFRIVGKNWQT